MLLEIYRASNNVTEFDANLGVIRGGLSSGIKASAPNWAHLLAANSTSKYALGPRGNRMRTIWDALKGGNGKERLAVVADIVQIVGISLASILAGMFAVEGKLDPNAVIGTIILALLSLSVSAVILAIFFAISSLISHLLHEYKLFRWLLQIALWSVFTALVLWGVLLAYDFLTRLSFIRR